MSTNKNYNPIEIQHYLFQLFDDKVSKNTYMTNIPKKLEGIDSDFVVISLPISMRDFDAYGDIRVVVEIFTKADERGLQNNALMRDLYNKYIDILDIENSNDTSPYIICKTNEGSFLDYDENAGFHVIVNNFKLIIKK